MDLAKQGRHPAAALLLVLLCILSNAVAVNYVFDENLFSKDTWHLWKLDSPLDGINPSNEMAVRDVPYPDVTATSHNSLDGPGPRKLGLQTHEWVLLLFKGTGGVWPRDRVLTRRVLHAVAVLHHAAPPVPTSRHWRTKLG